MGYLLKDLYLRRVPAWWRGKTIPIPSIKLCGHGCMQIFVCTHTKYESSAKQNGVVLKPVREKHRNVEYVTLASDTHDLEPLDRKIYPDVVERSPKFRHCPASPSSTSPTSGIVPWARYDIQNFLSTRPQFKFEHALKCCYL